MRILGIDFTSAPSPKKPITVAECLLEGDVLQVKGIRGLPSFEGFEAVLKEPGPWVAGIDFPFGLPREFVKACGWPADWEGYVSKVGEIGLEGFIEAVEAYKAKQPKGKKHPKRLCDTIAGAASPLMLYGVPVGRMFARGAPRILESGALVVPCLSGDPDRITVEAYPKLVALRVSGPTPYKTDNPKKENPVHRAGRESILHGLSGATLETLYGLKVVDLPRCLKDDFTGDSIDAVLCAVQAAWRVCAGEPDRRYGRIAVQEGVISDPAVVGTMEVLTIDDTGVISPRLA